MINKNTSQNDILSNGNGAGIIEITNLDLYSNKYNENILIYNMDKLSPYSILETQENLSNSFIQNYILNKKYYIFREDHDITLQHILRLYPNFEQN